MKVLECKFLDGMDAKKHRKENHYLQEFMGVVVIDDIIRVGVTCRIYGTNSRNYCCIWFNDGNKWGYGSGSAGGYGYHRPSAAFEEAMRSAGVKFSEPINGRGQSVMVDAIQSLLEHLYPQTTVRTVLEANP